MCLSNAIKGDRQDKKAVTLVLRFIVNVYDLEWATRRFILEGAPVSALRRGLPSFGLSSKCRYLPVTGIFNEIWLAGSAFVKALGGGRMRPASNTSIGAADGAHFKRDS
jgi:hypothetical protein